MDDIITSAAASSELLATLTSTAAEVISTAIGDSPFDWSLSNSTTNGTSPTDVIGGDVEVGGGSYVLNTFIGLLIVLLASVLNALGLNLTKLDHVRQQSTPKRQRRKQWLRLLWLSGMGIYIASQVFGSPLALKYLRPDWVAPLGSSSLVFNFLFASWLVGTPVTPADIRGTVVIVLGVILILIFSSINHGLTQTLSITRLNSLWTRGSWIAYFVFLILFTCTTYFTSHLLTLIIKSRASFSPLPSPTMELPTSRPKPSNGALTMFKRLGAGLNRVERVLLGRVEGIFQRSGDDRIIWLQGIGWAVTGGSLAGLCLVFTKAVVNIYALPGHPLAHPSALISLLLVIGTAILQIVCLNRALECADTVVVVPLFYAGYTVFGFIDSLIFYNETGQFARWVLIATFLSIGVLISGVVLLSLKSSAKTAPDPYTITTEPSSSMRMRPHTRAKSFVSDTDGEAGPSKLSREESEEVLVNEPRRGNGKGKEDVLWEVGSVSDGSDTGDQGEKETGTRGVGATKGGGGERRGLLDEEEGIDEGGDGQGQGIRSAGRNPFADGREVEDEDGFGEYEAVSSAK